MAQAERLSPWQALQQRTKHGDSIFWLVTLFFALLVIALVFAVGYVTWAGSSEARARGKRIATGGAGIYAFLPAKSATIKLPPRAPRSHVASPGAARWRARSGR